MNVTDTECAECGANIGEWCYTWEIKYTFPPYELRKIYRPGVLLTHSVRRQLTTQQVEKESEQ